MSDERSNFRRIFGSHPPTNYFSRLPPSHRLQQAAREAGVTGGTAEIDAWAKSSGWLEQGGSKR